MQLFSSLSSVFLLASCVVVQGSCSKCPLDLKPLVTGTILLGKPLKPIKIPGGQRTITPIVGGNLTGLINASIEGGVAYPQNYDNNTVSFPTIILYGTTSDNASFLIQEAGVGSVRHQTTRINLEIGGKAAPFMNEFIIATVDPSKDRKSVAIKGYVVE